MAEIPPLATYISHQEYFGRACSLENFRIFLRRFKKEKLVYTCCVINALLETWQDNMNLNSHEKLIKDAFFPDDAHKLLEMCKNTDHPRVVFHRL